jgi:hypothetical protein
MRSDVHEGRALLYEANSTRVLPVDDKDLMGKVYRALATLNAAASLAYRGAVPLAWILDYWHHNLREVQLGYELAVQSRESWRPMPWPDLTRLITDAQSYRCPACLSLSPQSAVETERPSMPPEP